MVTSHTEVPLAGTTSIGFTKSNITNPVVKADPTLYQLQLEDGTKYNVVKNTEAGEDAYAVLYLPSNVDLSKAVFVSK